MSELIPIECEARLVGLSKQRRKDGDWIEVKFHIHPDDHPAALFILPLGTDCMLSVKGVAEIAGDETPKPESVAEQVRPKGGPISQQAGRLCNDPAFQRWYAKQWTEKPPDISDSEWAARCIRAQCGVSSRAEIDSDSRVAITFKRIVDQFYASQQGRTDSALQAQRDRAG